MKLTEMSPEAVATYWQKSIANFAQEKVAAEGMAPDAAQEAAVAAFARASPEDSPHEHVLAHLEVDGQVVGTMWFVVRPEWGQPCVWLYELTVDAEHRGKGYGRRAMSLLEREARARGIENVGLHVFGHNTVAIGLYESLGFAPTSIVMRKGLV